MDTGLCNVMIDWFFVASRTNESMLGAEKSGKIL
jgi:hypothetical protein